MPTISGAHVGEGAQSQLPVFDGAPLIVADGKHFNGAASYRIAADLLDIESVPIQAKPGLFFKYGVRKDFDALKASIKAGSKPFLKQ